MFAAYVRNLQRHSHIAISSLIFNQRVLGSNGCTKWQPCFRNARFHSTFHQTWLNGDEFIISSMEESLMILRERQYWLNKDYDRLFNLMNRILRKMFGDDAFGALNIEMVEIARQVGAASKFTGCGRVPGGSSQARQLLEDDFKW